MSFRDRYEVYMNAADSAFVHSGSILRRMLNKYIAFITYLVLILYFILITLYYSHCA
jgi:hypothetical protein